VKVTIFGIFFEEILGFSVKKWHHLMV